MKKQLYVLVAFLMAASMVLAACGGASTAAPATSAPATDAPMATEAPATDAPAQPAEVAKFEVWTTFVPGGDAARYQAMEAVIAEFNKQNPDIEVTQQYFEAAEFKKSVQLAVESQQAACLIDADIYSANLLPWYYADDLVVLDNYALQYGWLDLDAGGAIVSANEGTRPSSVYDGPEIAGLPWLYQPLGIFYNQTIFDENGITPPRPGTS